METQGVQSHQGCVHRRSMLILPRDRWLSVFRAHGRETESLGHTCFERASGCRGLPGARNEAPHRPKIQQAIRPLRPPKHWFICSANTEKASCVKHGLSSKSCSQSKTDSRCHKGMTANCELRTMSVFATAASLTVIIVIVIMITRRS